MCKRASVAIGLALLVWMSTAAAVQVCKDTVLAKTPTSRFSDHGDGTVTDEVTGLMWKRCAEGLVGEGCASGGLETFTWQQALRRAADAVFAGHTDWRLPNKKELASLLEVHCIDPAINLSVFPNTLSGWYWSSSPYAGYSGFAWVVRFGYGYVYSGDKNDAHYVRLVRGG